MRLSSGLAQDVGLARLSVDLPGGATVADLVQRLQAQHPQAAGRLGAAIAVMAGQPVALAEPLRDGLELALLMPVAGG